MEHLNSKNRAAMSNIILISVLLYINIFEAHGSNRTSFLPKRELTKWNPDNDVIDNNFYTASMRGNRLWLVTNLKNVDNCYMLVNTKKYFISSKLHASALGNGNVVVWGIEEGIRDDWFGLTRTSHVFFVINRKRCMYEALPVFHDYTPRDWPAMNASVVTYYNTFDVFMPSQQNCFPCRYDDKGKRIKLLHQFPVTSDVPAGDYHVHAIHGDYRKPLRFVFASNSIDNNQAIMRTIHPDDFRVLKEIRVNHTIDVAAAQLSAIAHPMIGICYKNDEDIICEKYESPLDISFKSTLKLNQTLGPVLLYNLKINDYGYFYVTIIQSLPGTASTEDNLVHVSVHFLNAFTGKTMRIVDYGEFLNNFYSLNSLVIRGEELCVALSYSNLEFAKVTCKRISHY